MPSSALTQKARIGRRLEHHDLAPSKARRNLGGCALDDGEIRLSVTGQRRRQRDQDRVHLLECVVVARRRNSTGVDERLVFFFKDAATTEFSTLSLHDALPI